MRHLYRKAASQGFGKPTKRCIAKEASSQPPQGYIAKEAPPKPTKGYIAEVASSKLSEFSPEGACLTENWQKGTYRAQRGAACNTGGPPVTAPPLTPPWSQGDLEAFGTTKAKVTLESPRGFPGPPLVPGRDP